MPLSMNDGCAVGMYFKFAILNKNIMCKIMYKGILNKRKILNKREYVGPVDVWPANDIFFCSIFTYFQYSLIHDSTLYLSHNVRNLIDVILEIEFDQNFFLFASL